MKQHLGVTHEAKELLAEWWAWPWATAMAIATTYLVILSSMLRGSRMNVGKTTLLRSAPGRSWEMMCESTVVLLSVPSARWLLVGLTVFVHTIALIGLDNLRVILTVGAVMFVCRTSASFRLCKPAR